LCRKAKIPETKQWHHSCFESVLKLQLLSPRSLIDPKFKLATMSPVVWLKSDFNRSILDIEVIELFTFPLFISYLSRPIYPTVVIMLRLLYIIIQENTPFLEEYAGEWK
jgi:hypothetical protein